MHQYIEEKIKLEINMPSMTQLALKQKITDAMNSVVIDGPYITSYNVARLKQQLPSPTQKHTTIMLSYY